MTHKEIVTLVLTKIPEARDSDNRLLAVIWTKILEDVGAGISQTSADVLLEKISNGDLPSAEAITRCRRKIQEHTPKLRGKLWGARHKRAAYVSAEMLGEEVW